MEEIEQFENEDAYAGMTMSRASIRDAEVIGFKEVVPVPHLDEYGFPHYATYEEMLAGKWMDAINKNDYRSIALLEEFLTTNDEELKEAIINYFLRQNEKLSKVNSNIIFEIKADAREKHRLEMGHDW